MKLLNKQGGRFSQRSCCAGKTADRGTNAIVWAASSRSRLKICDEGEAAALVLKAMNGRECREPEPKRPAQCCACSSSGGCRRASKEAASQVCEPRSRPPNIASTHNCAGAGAGRLGRRQMQAVLWFCFTHPERGTYVC
eukprot:229477-Chlamydomonas_euryale.AAC.8